MQSQFTRLGAAMEATRKASPVQNRGDLYRDQITAVRELKGAFNEAALASGQWHQQTVQTISASERLTKAIAQQKVGWSQARKELSAYRQGQKGALSEAIKEQQALRNSMATQWGGQPFGKNATDLYIPKNLGSELDNIHTKYGMINRMLYSAAHQTVNWGKNTQWAGRQIMVGLTVPLGMAAVGAGVLAAKVDKELTRVAKVYDTTATTAEGRERELANVRKVGLTQATRLAQEYGLKMEDVINIQAQLAATGLNGDTLFRSAAEAGRIATLGEMDVQNSIDMTVALQTAFRDTIKTAKDLTETFDFFNSVENATSLSIQDIAEATPRAASAMAALGVDAKEMTVMLVAMKESGVDAAEAANALKSGATRILDPTKEAVAYWRDVLDKDLPAIVKKAGGNMFDFIKQVSTELHGLDPQIVQTAIAKTFGAYQFNRQTALITNMGDALTGTANQTAKSFELLSQSAQFHADGAAREMAKLQESVSFRFKAAVESIKADLIPLGETALEVGIKLMNVLKWMISGFNDLSGPVKGGILLILGIGAVVGPLLMITGIMANLFGNVMKVGLQLGNLRYKFKAMSAEEAAAAISARTANSAFNTEAGAAAHLAQQIAILTRTMEANAIASGHMMSANGTLMNTLNGAVVGQRQVVRRANGSLGYAAGSTYAPGTVGAKGQNLGGRSAAGHSVRPEDAARFEDLEKRTAAAATNTQKVERHMGGAAKAAGIISVATLGITALASGSENINYTWLNIAMVVGMVATTFPNLLIGPVKGSLNLLKNMKTLGSGAVLGKMALGAASIAGSFQAAGKGVNGVGAAMRTFGGMIPMALRIFGPLGLIAGGVLLFKHVNDELKQAVTSQTALGSAAEDWAQVIGFEFNPGALPGMSEGSVSDYQNRIKLVNQMKDANEELAPALRQAAADGKMYEAAMMQALQAVTNGATPEQAREVMQASLQMAGAKPFEIPQMMVKFDRVDLANPEEIRSQIGKQIDDIFENVGTVTLHDTHSGNMFEEMWLGIKEAFGGDLSPAMEAAGRRAGQYLITGLKAAGDDPAAMGEVFDNITDQTNKAFGDMMSKMRANDQLNDFFKKWGVESADQLGQIWDAYIKNRDDGIDNNYTPIQKDLKRILDDAGEAGTMLGDFQDKYEEFLDNLVTGIGEVMGLDESEIEVLRSRIGSIMDIRTDEYGLPRAFISAKDAMEQYTNSVSRGASSWAKYSDAEKLRILNTYRAKAGLVDATHWTQAFGTAADGAAGEIETMANVTRDAANAANDLYQITADDAVGAQRSAMQGAWNDLLGEAERRYKDMRENVVEGIRAAGDRRQKAFEVEEKNQQAHFDTLEKQLDATHETQNRSTESYWDNQEKLAQDAADAEDAAYDARIKAIQDTIDAEEKAEAKRQAIFEAEQRRIERMAESLNSSIDFNVALNSGNLDDAAKIANDVSARNQQWSLDDQNRGIGSVVDQRRTELESQIEALTEERDARREVHQEKLDQINEARDSALQALKDQQDAERENLRIQRQISEENLNNRRENDRLSTESHIRAEQRKTEIDGRELAQRLRKLQEFIPQNEAELRQHITDVEAAYREYGIDLTRQGNGWAQEIGRALDINVDVAAAALQTQINWRQIAANIASQIGEGMGMTMGQVTEFLRTGNWPANTPPGAPAYRPTATGPMVNNRDAQGQNGRVGGVFRHSGGEVPYTGGKAPSQASRVGVPRSSGLYPSEVPLVAKAGEFVVKKNAAQANMDLLRTINNGDGKRHGIPRHAGGEVNANDIGGPMGPIGGLMEYTAGIAALNMVAAAKVAQIVATKKVQMGKEAYEASLYGGGGGTIDGSGPVYQRLFATIKRAFPRANLNSGLRNSNDYHGKGMAVDLGEQGFAGGAGRPYLAAMNRWIYDNFHGATELIYNGLGDDRPNLKNGRDFAYNSATQAQHRNHVHWAMTPEAIAAANRSGMMATGGGANYAPGSVRQQVQTAANQRGWGSGANWAAIDWVINRESSWNPNAQNPSSTASGLFQHIDGTWRAYRSPSAGGYAKMRLAPVAEQAWAGMNYFGRRYGSPVAAKAFWERNHWYDDGGYLNPGEVGHNTSRKPEPVFTGAQWDILKANIGSQTFDLPGRASVPMPVRVVGDNVATGAQNVYDIDIDLRGAYIKEELDIQTAVEKAIDAREAKNGRRRVIS